MELKKYRIFAVWSDAGTDDADEFYVDAASHEDAVRKATEKWKNEICVEYPTCELKEVIVVPLKKGGGLLT